MMETITPKLLSRVDYDAASHSYFVEDERYPSVNEFADTMLGAWEGSHDPYYPARGTVVHEACETISRVYREGGTVEVAEMGLSDVVLNGAEVLAADIEPFVMGWDSFLRSSGWESIAIEEAIYSDRYKLAGRPDDIGRFRGGPLVVLDIKTGGQHPRYDFCSAAYLTIGNEYYEETIEERCYVYLKKDGSFRLKFAKRKNDLAAFKHAAEWKIWKDQHG